MKYQLEKLPYEYDALEPVMDAKTVEVHYAKHHTGYNKKLNAAVEGLDLDYTLEELLSNIDKLPKEIQTAVKNNGGGHYNHSLYWKILTPDMGQKPQGKLLEEIEKTYGSFENFKQEFEKAGLTRFGSGWAWLVRTKEGSLKIMNLPYQDVPFEFGKPLIAIDVWEHAYYLKHQNMRATYLSDIWQILNWRYVEKLFEEK